MPDPTPPRFAEIDVLRGLAILAVVLTHCYDTFTDLTALTTSTWLYMTATMLLRFAVPCFVFASGFALYARYGPAPPLRAFYAKRARAVVPAYLAASGAGIALRVAVGHLPAAAVTPAAVAGMLATGTAFYHLWFFVPLIEIYLLYPLIARLYGAARERGREPLLLAACLGLAALFFVPVPDALAPLHTAMMFAGYLIYFVLGMAVRARYDRVAAFRTTPRQRMAAGIVVVAGVAFGLAEFVTAHYAPGVLPAGSPGRAVFLAVWAVAMALAWGVLILGLLRGARRARGRAGDALAALGRRSLEVYLIHAFVLSLLALTGAGLGVGRGTLAAVPVAVALVLAASWAATAAIDRGRALTSRWAAPRRTPPR